MAASGNQPVSAANLAAALGVSASGSIGSQPISVDNLKAALNALGVGGMTVLYDGAPANSVTLSRPLEGFDAYYVESQFSGNFVYGVTTQEYVDKYSQFYQFFMDIQYTNNVFHEAFPFAASGTSFRFDESGKTVTRIIGIRFNQ